MLPLVSTKREVIESKHDKDCGASCDEPAKSYKNRTCGLWYSEIV